MKSIVKLSTTDRISHTRIRYFCHTEIGYNGDIKSTMNLWTQQV
jgi:hypothetical protein